MALERENHAKKSTEVVEHFYSPVVEGHITPILYYRFKQE